MTKELRCYHRHDIEHHRSCFEKGLIKYDFKDEKEFERLTGIPWYEFKDENGEPFYKIGFFDIETDGFKADFSGLLTWAIKELNGKTYTSVITQEELFTGKLDKRLVEEFLETIKNFNILVGYYSIGFDMKFMRAKALHYDLDFPGYALQKNSNDKYYVKPELMHWDLYFTVKRNLGISSKSLDNACDYLNISGKTPISKSAWRAAKYGDPKAISLVLEHNIADVDITEQLFKKLQKYQKWTRSG